MKKITMLLLVLSITFAAASALADNSTKVTLSVKSWYNYWDHTVDYADGTNDKWNNGSAFMVGPALNIKAGGLFFGATYLQSVSDYKASDWYVTGDSMSFSRKDLDFTLGYMFVPYVGVFVGYKSIDAPMTYTNALGKPNTKYDGSWTLKGPGVGILANAPLGRSAAVYTNLAFMKIKQEYSDSFGKYGDFDMTGASFELGFAFAFSKSVSSNIGYKYQTFWGDDSTGDTHHMNFYGPTLGLNLSF